MTWCDPQAIINTPRGEKTKNKEITEIKPADFVKIADPNSPPPGRASSREGEVVRPDEGKAF